MKKSHVIGILCLGLVMSGCTSNGSDYDNEKTSTEENTTQKFNGSSEGGNGNPNASVTSEVETKTLSDFFENRAQGTVMDRLRRFQELVGRFNDPENKALADSLRASIKGIDESIKELPVETKGDAEIQNKLTQMYNYYDKAVENFKKYEDTGDISYMNKGNELVNKGYTLEVEVKRDTNLI